MDYFLKQAEVLDILDQEGMKREVQARMANEGWET